jgi:hypothetical protein
VQPRITGDGIAMRKLHNKKSENTRAWFWLVRLKSSRWGRKIAAHPAYFAQLLLVCSVECCETAFAVIYPLAVIRAVVVRVGV